MYHSKHFYRFDIDCYSNQILYLLSSFLKLKRTVKILLANSQQVKFKLDIMRAILHFDKYNFKKPNIVLSVAEYDGIGSKKNTYYRRKICTR